MSDLWGLRDRGNYRVHHPVRCCFPIHLPFISRSSSLIIAAPCDFSSSKTSRTCSPASPALCVGRGYSVDTAEDGEDGLFKALEIDYDAIVLDVMLPRMDGWAVLAKLREKKEHACDDAHRPRCHEGPCAWL